VREAVVRAEKDEGGKNMESEKLREREEGWLPAS
jgi:hypothetical protein